MLTHASARALGLLAASVLLFGGACGGGDTPPPAEAPANDQPTASTASPEAAASGRLAVAQLDALGEPPDSPCRAHRVEAGLAHGGCRIVGPFPGALEGDRGATSDTYAEALDACAAASDCAGVSSDWYTGSPWYPVLGAAGFVPDTASYACTLVLDCR